MHFLILKTLKKKKNPSWGDTLSHVHHSLCSNLATSFACESQHHWVLQGFIFLHFPSNNAAQPLSIPNTILPSSSSLTLILFLLMPGRQN